LKSEKENIVPYSTEVLRLEIILATRQSAHPQPVINWC